MFYHRRQPRRSSSFSSIFSLWSSPGDEAAAHDAHISRDTAADPAPAVADECPERRPSVRGFDDRGRKSSTCSVRSCGGMSADETKELWKCMLELQQRYGCYNSTRMDLAVGAGDEAVNLMPNPFILDTLNDSVIDLPDEGWEMLYRCLGHEDPTTAK